MFTQSIFDIQKTNYEHNSPIATTKDDKNKKKENPNESMVELDEETTKLLR